MILLISTGRGLLRYDTERAETRLVEDDRFGYYGLSWIPGGDELVISHSGEGKATFDDLAGYVRSEVGYLSCGERESPPFLSAPHQMLCIDTTYALVCNTGRNALTQVRLDDFCSLDHRFDDVMWDRFDPSGRTGAHFNSVYYRDGKVYLLAHNFERGSTVLVLEWPGLRKLEEVRMPHGGAHNVWATASGDLLVCDSMNGALVAPRTGETLWSNNGVGMTRGLAATEEHIFIGENSFAPRALRDQVDGGIWVVDRKSLRTLDYIPLHGWGSVKEIRIADLPDDCHHGVPLRAVPAGRELVQVLRERKLVQMRGLARPQGWTFPNGAIAAPAMGENGRMTGRTDGLTCAVTGPVCSDVRVAGTFDFSAAAEGDHASLIGRHRGPGDSHMYAALFQWSAGSVTATLWRNEGQWELLEQTRLAAATVRFDAAFELLGERLRVEVDGRELLSHAGAATTPGRVGLRFMNASVAVTAFSWNETG